MTTANRILFVGMWLAILANFASMISAGRMVKRLEENPAPAFVVKSNIVTNWNTATNWIVKTNYVPFVTSNNHLCPQCTDLVMSIAITGFMEGQWASKFGSSTNHLVEWMRRYFEHAPSWADAVSRCTTDYPNK